MLHHPHVFCNHVLFSRVHTGSSWWAGQTWPPLIPCRCMLVGYGWWACHAAQRRASALLRFLHASSHVVLAYNPQITSETHYHPRTCMGILHDLPQAHMSYDARVTQHTILQAVASLRTWHKHSLVGWQQAMEQPRATLPRAALAVRKDAQCSSLVAAGTPALTLESAVCVAVHEALEAQAGLLAFVAWLQTQEDA
jgi:hypothetical protein